MLYDYLVCNNRKYAYALNRNVRYVSLLPTIEIEEIQNKKRLMRINWNTVQKIIVLLHRNGRMKKTHIAMQCRLRYDKCVSHIAWCESLKLIKTRIENRSELIGLTDRGIELYREQFAHQQIDLEP